MALPTLSARQVDHARTIITVCQGLIPNPVLARLAAVYAISCSLAEASLTNWENGGTSQHTGRAEGRKLNDAERAVARQSRGLGDGVPPWGDNLDSMGLFAQRPMSGWGPPKELMRPSVATSKFLLGPAGRSGLLGRKDWATAPFADVVAKVQGYYDAKIYTDSRALAEETVARLWPLPVPTSGSTTEKDESTMATKEETVAAANAAAGQVPAAVWNQPIGAGYKAQDYVRAQGERLDQIKQLVTELGPYLTIALTQVLDQRLADFRGEILAAVKPAPSTPSV